ncbi:hypothetical protein AOLI_G00124270 [Acnodon oligacanthus]
MNQSEQVGEETHWHIETVLKKNKEQADRHRGFTPVYQPGDRVWLPTRDFCQAKGSRKLQAKYIGPFEIVKRINEVIYRLDLPPQFRVSCSLLKPVIAGPLDEVSLGDTPPLPEVTDSAPVYTVQRLLDSRRQGGLLQYKMDWEGYGPEEQCWVPAKDVLDPGLIADFHSQHLEKPAPRPRGRLRKGLSDSLPDRLQRHHDQTPSVQCLSSSGSAPVQKSGGGFGGHPDHPHTKVHQDSLEGGIVTYSVLRRTRTAFPRIHW